MTTATTQSTGVRIRYRDLRVKDSQLKKELLEAVEKVLTHGWIILGPEVMEFERQVAQMCKKKYAVGMNSGTDALYLALRSLDIGPGDEVITTPLSWIATLNAITLCGATPVFVDITEDLNINVDLIEEAITSQTKAIIPVHFTGKLCNILEIGNIAEKHNIPVIEDAAQAFGAQVNGQPAGSFGTINCFSLNPMKVLCAFGEAGIAVTDDKALYEKLCSLRYAGTINKEDCHYPSLNGRIDTIQAAMLLVNLKYLDKKTKRRQEIAHMYTQELNDIVTCPKEDNSVHAYYSYTIIADQRDALKDYLLTEGIETKIQHPILMPYHQAYRGKYICNIPIAERIVERILCIPNEDHLSDEEVQIVASCIKEFYGRKKS